MTQINDKQVVIVGGGIAGIMAALWVQSAGFNVTLVERAKKCGGLLGSFTTDDGQLFDYGTHIPCLTAHTVIDELMFGTNINIDWSDIPRLNKGNVFRGKLNTTSQFIDISGLNDAEYQRGLAELINLPTTESGAANLQEALQTHYGDFLTQQVFTPLLRRLYKKPFTELATTSHKFLAYGRVVAASSEMSKELKRSPIYDAKIAFKNSNEGGVEACYRYPLEGGTGAWVDAMIAKLTALGGQVLTEAGIEGISMQDQKLRLMNGTEINFDKLIWTGPIGQLARMVLPAIKTTPPDFAPTRLHHFVVSEKPLCDSHYLYMNDPEYLSFRVTLYPNITQKKNDYRITVEAIANEDSEEQQKLKVFSELQHGGIISQAATLQSASSQLLPAGFPEMTVAQNQQNELLRNELDKFNSIVLGGRGSTEAFFMIDVLIAMAKQLEQQFGLPNI